MGDNGACKILGVRDIRINMFDGCIRIITNVRHVPALRKGLLSLRKFAQQGLKFISENCQLKVVKGIMVVAKGELLGNLYRLVGETLVGEAVGASAKSESPAL